MNLVSMAEAAKRLGISRARIYLLAKDGRLQTVEIFGRMGVTEAELLRFAKINRQNGRPKKAAA